MEFAKGKLKSSDRTEADLFTYEAYIYKVLDGDTIMAVVDLGFGITTTQTLRLRGIDCPEIQTRDGMEAKEFVETSLKGADYLTIKTVKSDKYDRYLTDVFVEQKNGSNLYLNNELIEKGLAVRVRE